jgi:hypothetical protein
MDEVLNTLTQTQYILDLRPRIKFEYGLHP